MRTYVRVMGGLFLREPALMQLNALATATGRSRSELIRQGVDDLLERHGYSTTTRSGK